MILNIKHVFKFISLVFVIALVASCTKKLDLTPPDQIDASKAFRNLDDINKGAIGAYALLGYDDVTNTSLVSDECMLPNENGTGGGVATHRWQYDGSSGTVTGYFSDSYVVIDRLNRVLDAIDKVPSSPSDAQIKNQYRAEMLALRAYVHFELLRNYASKYETGALGVTYMTESVISFPARLSFEQTISKIKDDLQAAKTLMPASFNDKSRITLPAISAIQARVALYEKNWPDAVTYATEAIAYLPLASKTQFADIWKDKSDAEVFWKLKKATSADGLLGNFYFNTNNTVLYGPANKLLKLFNRVTDIRFTNYIKVDSNRGLNKTPNIVIKYVGGTSVKNLADVKLFRTGEMYLIRAEANAELTKLTDANNDLNYLRAARINGYTDTTYTTKDDFINALMTERFKELAFEGQRFFDLKRRNLSVQRNPEDAVNALGAVLLNPTDAQYSFPLPDSEVKVNKNMKQNPGYQ
ncbi:MAG: RagB/SusD family nutrient uptake outer membrane protein [Bacteroidetes bacterium]|nr:RagB/SusD family nutrient uptake outer membrane protein [Bacteroidota bacterium]